MFPMTEVSGFCLKCKTYGPIKDGKMIVMSNGRTRCAGFCSQPGMYWKNFQNRILNDFTDLDIYRINVGKLRGLVV